MSNTRATLRTLIETFIGTSYGSTQLNRWINEAIQDYSNNIPAYNKETSTVTGTSITITRRIVEVDYLIIDGEKWEQLPEAHPSFTDDNHYDIHPNGNSTTITLSASQTSATYIIAYRAPLPILTDDNATSIPDIHKHLIIHHVITSALRHLLAEEMEAATNTDNISFIKTAVDVAYGRYYQALELAEEHDAQGIQIL